MSYATITNASQTSKPSPVNTSTKTTAASGGGGGGPSSGTNNGGNKGGSSTPPSRPSSSYTIKSGDTIGNLAWKFGVSSAALLAANPQITNPNRIYAGATLNVPGKK